MVIRGPPQKPRQSSGKERYAQSHGGGLWAAGRALQDDAVPKTCTAFSSLALHGGEGGVSEIGLLVGLGCNLLPRRRLAARWRIRCSPCWLSCHSLVDCGVVALQHL